MAKSSPKKRAPKKKSGRQRDEVVSTEKRMLPVEIDEKLTRQKEHRIAKALTEKKEEQELMNAEILPRRKAIKALEAEIETLRNQVMKGTEDREVTCDVVKDYAHLKVIVRRRDNGETVEDRTMTAEDRQEDIETRTRAGSVDGDGVPVNDDPGEAAEDDEPPELQ